MESSPNCASNIKRIYADSIHPEIIRKRRIPEEIENYLIPLDVLNIKNRIWRSSWISLVSTFYSVYYRTPDVRWLKIWSRVLNMMAFIAVIYHCRIFWRYPPSFERRSGYWQKLPQVLGQYLGTIVSASVRIPP